MKPKQLFNYVNAWIAYAGAFLTQLSKIGDTVRNSFDNIHVPKKEDYINEPKQDTGK